MRKRSVPPLLLALVLVSIEARAAHAEAYMVFVSPGEDAASEVHVSWHSSASGTSLELTTRDDPGYSSSTLVSGGSITEVFDSTTFGTGIHRCHARLGGLDAGTEYIFRIGKDSFGADHHFETAGAAEELSFVFMSDVHAYPRIQSRVDRAVSLVSRAEQIEGDLDFILFAGDLTAHGANYTHWENLAAAPFLSEYMVASSPGNHDYYNSSAQTIDERYYDLIFKNPDNGALGVLNTTYWFRYGNALFISLNTEANSTAEIQAQRDWLADVIDQNPAQYVIAFAHRAFFLGSTTIEGGGVVRKSSSYGWFGHLFEELDVDLVLAGHNHVYVRTHPMREGAVASGGDGTVYITTNQIGDRGRMAASDLGEYGAAIHGGATSSESISTVTSITVGPAAISGRTFDAAGAMHDTFSIPARRDPPVHESDREAFMDSFSARVNPEDLENGILEFGEEGYGLATTIEVLDADDGDDLYASFAPAEGVTEQLFGPLEPGGAYRLLVSVDFRDGGGAARHLHLLNKLSPGTYSDLRVHEEGDDVILKWENRLVVEEIDRIAVLVNDEWSLSVRPDDSSVDITEGSRPGGNLVEFIVVDRYGDAVFEEILEYDYSLGDAEEEPEGGEEEGRDDTSSGGQWEVAGGGCGSSAPALIFFLMTGCVMLLGAPRPLGRPLT